MANFSLILFLHNGRIDLWKDNLLGRNCADVRHRDFVHKGAEAEAEVGRDALHPLGEKVAKLGQLVLVVLHGFGEVHQVVEIHWVILSLGVLQLHVVSFICNMTSESEQSFLLTESSKQSVTY